MMRFLLVCNILFLIISCSGTEEKIEKSYFDFEGLIDNQVAELYNRKVIIHKKSVINGKADSVSYAVDSMTLVNELDVFRKLDIINRPVYRNSYQISEAEKDTKSNLLIQSYTADHLVPVSQVKLYYQQSPALSKKIEATYVDDNNLQTIHHNLMLLFDDYSGEHLITGYKLSGFQKMILSDTVHFEVDVNFTITNN